MNALLEPLPVWEPPLVPGAEWEVSFWDAWNARRVSVWYPTFRLAIAWSRRHPRYAKDPYRTKIRRTS